MCIHQAIWRQAFGFVNPALTAWDVKNKYGNKRVCFRKVGCQKSPKKSPMTPKRDLLTC